MAFDYHNFADSPYLYHHSGMDNSGGNDKNYTNNVVILINDCL